MKGSWVWRLLEFLEKRFAKFAYSVEEGLKHYFFLKMNEG